MSKSEIKPKLFGWYDSPEQEVTKPTYNPPMICLYCTKKINKEDCRTVSILGEKQRSYFYRVHKLCHDNTSSEEQIMYETSILESND